MCLLFALMQITNVRSMYICFIVITVYCSRRITLKGFTWSLSNKGHMTVSDSVIDFSLASVENESEADTDTIFLLNRKISNVLDKHILY